MNGDVADVLAGVQDASLLPTPPAFADWVRSRINNRTTPVSEQSVGVEPGNVTALVEYDPADILGGNP